MRKIINTNKPQSQQSPPEPVWKYNKRLSIEENEPIYSHKFPVYKYKNGTDTILDGEFLLYQNTCEVTVNVYNRSMGNVPYAPFYGYEYGNYQPILDIINKNIDKEAKKIGVVKDDDGYCWQGM